MSKTNVIQDRVKLGKEVWNIVLIPNKKTDDMFNGNIKVTRNGIIINRQIAWNVAKYNKCTLRFLNETNYDNAESDSITLTNRLLELSRANGFVLIDSYNKYWSTDKKKELAITSIEEQIKLTKEAKDFTIAGGYKSGVAAMNAAIEELIAIKKKLAELTPDPDKMPVPKAESNDSASLLSEQCRVYMQCSGTDSVAKAFDEALTHLNEVETSAEDEAAHFIKIEEENEELLNRIEAQVEISEGKRKEQQISTINIAALKSEIKAELKAELLKELNVTKLSYDEKIHGEMMFKSSSTKEVEHKPMTLAEKRAASTYDPKAENKELEEMLGIASDDSIQEINVSEAKDNMADIIANANKRRAEAKAKRNV